MLMINNISNVKSSNVFSKYCISHTVPLFDNNLKYTQHPFSLPRTVKHLTPILTVIFLIFQDKI